MSKRTDVVATIKMTLADGTTVVDIDVLREDVTSTNGAYRCIRDQAADEIREVLSGMLHAHRSGEWSDRETSVFQCRDIGYGIETGEVLLPAIDGPDWAGKSAYTRTDGETVYLFPDELV